MKYFQYISNGYKLVIEISQRMGFADGYVGKVENFGSSARYNIRKMHLAAKH